MKRVDYETFKKYATGVACVGKSCTTCNFQQHVKRVNIWNCYFNYIYAVSNKKLKSAYEEFLRYCNLKELGLLKDDYK